MTTANDRVRRRRRKGEHDNNPISTRIDGATVSTSKDRTEINSNHSKRGYPKTNNNASYSCLKRPRSSFPHNQSAALISPGTRRACMLLTVTMIVGVGFNWWEHHRYQTLAGGRSHDVQAFLRDHCQSKQRDHAATDTSISCHSSLVPARFSQQVQRRKIMRGETVATIPRHWQIWDVDALQDQWIQKESMGKESLSPAAYLAVHLARLIRAASQGSPADTIEKDSELWNRYLTKVLPTYEDYARYHPILWSDHEIRLHLSSSSTAAHVLSWKSLVRKEYDIFASRATAFSEQITFAHYVTARLHVLSRSFGTGPIEHHHDVAKKFDVDLTRGSYAMVPILDSYDHHPHPNVEFAYRDNAFVVSAISDIEKGYFIMDSYGKRTDSDLFARFGFVNGDGSGWTEANLAVWHNVSLVDGADEGSVVPVVRYLQYDDGYEDCVNPDADSPAWRLKRLKYHALRSIARRRKHWVVRMSPTNPVSLPGRSTEQPILHDAPPAPDPTRIQLDGTDLFATCRLISLTHHDYNGNASEVLQAALDSTQPLLLPVSPVNDALEYRTVLCVARLASTAEVRFNSSIDEQTTRIRELVLHSFASHAWTVAQLILGELRTLDVVKNLAFGKLRQKFGRNAIEENRGPGFSMRNQPCPSRFLHALVSEMASSS